MRQRSQRSAYSSHEARTFHKVVPADTLPATQELFVTHACPDGSCNPAGKALAAR